MAAPPESNADKSPEELLCAAAEAGNTDAIAELISSGADSTYFDGSGMTPLMHAATSGHAAAARLLLDAGAPWNALSPSGLSAGDLTSDPTTYDLLLDHALRSELILGTVARRQVPPANSSDGVPAESYLDSRVSFSEDRVMDADSKAVMMEWERPLMEAHARAVCTGAGKVLNVGFGMGLVDQAIQRYEPEEHTIIEAHPEVYARMLKLGWGEKKNVRILFGRWQDVIPQLGSYDGKFGCVACFPGVLVRTEYHVVVLRWRYILRHLRRILRGHEGVPRPPPKDTEPWRDLLVLQRAVRRQRVLPRGVLPAGGAGAGEPGVLDAVHPAPGERLPLGAGVGGREAEVLAARHVPSPGLPGRIGVRVESYRP
ncbi:unnamed protein product [Alopecurus aequalis]